MLNVLNVFINIRQLILFNILGSAASAFDNSFYMGSPQIGASSGHGPGNLFRSFPRPHSSPKMKLRFINFH